MEMFGYTPKHYDVLQEIGNVGAGHAVTSLSKIINRKVDMSVPVVNLLKFEEIADFVGGPESVVLGILVHIRGDIEGTMMFIVKKNSARKLIDFIMGRPHKESDAPFDEIELSALNEVGNILISAYLGALSSMIRMHVMPSVPFMAEDMANAILSVPAIEFGLLGDEIIFIETVFGDGVEDVSGYFLFVPNYESLEIILSTLGAN